MDRHKHPPEPVSAEAEELDRYLNLLTHADDATAVPMPDDLDESLASLARGLEQLGRILTLPKDDISGDGFTCQDCGKRFEVPFVGRRPQYCPECRVQRSYICLECGKRFEVPYEVRIQLVGRPPRHCPECEVQRREGAHAYLEGREERREDVHAYLATCAQCGRETTVPLDEAQDAVYCDDCLSSGITLYRR